jgi:Right handed beta helix region
VRNNLVHDNYGHGLWTDGININVLDAGNVVRDNDRMGIDHELGYAAKIRDNVVRGNGFEHPVQADAWGAGIFIDQSRDVEVYGNTVEDNAAGITAVQEPAGDPCGYGIAAVANLSVHDNTVRQPTGIAAGLRLLNESDQAYYSSMNNRWEDNTYHLDDLNAARFRWQPGYIDADAWRSYGNDRPGAVFDELSGGVPRAPRWTKSHIGSAHVRDTVWLSGHRVWFAYLTVRGLSSQRTDRGPFVQLGSRGVTVHVLR